MTEHQHCRTFNGCQVRTKFLNYTYDFSWSIENYPKWETGTKVTSPEFNPVYNYTFYATLERKLDTNFKYSDATMLIFHLKSETDNLHVKYDVSVTDSCQKKTFFTISKDYKYNNSATSCIFALITDHIKKYSDSTNDQILIFNCTMKIDYLCTEIGEKNLKISSSDNQPILVENLKAMYTSSLYADINLQVEDSVVRVHKSILCARSPVFAKMFESPMEENEKNAIAIPDIELSVLKDLLEFLYTGNLSADDFESVYALYYAADKYDVSSLRKTCVGVLLSKMDVGNACRALSLANQHSDVQFKDSAMDFVQFHFDEIVGTDSWEEFLEEETKLAADVMRCRSKKGKKVNVSK